MERRLKIRLLEHWLKNPEDMGDIPRQMSEFVTTNDIFSMKKELKWKPFTKDNVSSMLNKAKLTDFGGGGNRFRYSKKGNPYIGLIVFFILIIPTALNILSGLPRNAVLTYPIYTLVIFLAVAVILMAAMHRIKNKKGRRRDFHASASDKAAEAV